MKNKIKNKKYFLANFYYVTSGVVIIKDMLMNKQLRDFSHSRTVVNDNINSLPTFQYHTLQNFDFDNYVNTAHGFINKKRKMENRKRIQDVSSAKRDFMNSLNVCEDVKRYIYSFL